MIKKATNVQYGYTIEGNTIQDGVPSPQNPVIPGGTGERTGNLYGGTDISGTINNKYYKNDFVYANIAQGTYTLAFDLTTTYPSSEVYNSSIGVGETGYSKDIQAQSGKTDGHFVFTFTIEAEDAGKNLYARFARFGTAVTITYTASNIILNVGSTPLPYEPYGYKIPITSIGENLFDKNAEGVTSGKYVNGDGEEISSPNWKISDYIEITGNAVTISGVGGNAPAICAYDENKDYVRGTVYLSGSAQNLTTVTIATIGCKYVRFSYQSFMNPMLNLGPTALPYKPYIEPINTNIYLGQVETTRNIKKLVLTGEENFFVGNNCFVLWLYDVQYPNPKQELIYCTHYKGRTPTYRDSLANGQCMITINQNQIAIKDLSYATVDDFTTYLQQQYANGTPVTIWYVLTTEETSVVNEPLMKIGNYVDTINNTQSGIDITTNNLAVNTTIPPSDISINTSATWVPINYNKYNTETISTIAPIDFLSNGQDITVGLKGNTEQLEIPSPDNPVMPQGTGERTGNLVDRTTCTENKLLVWASGELYNEDGSIATDFIQVKSGDKFVSNYNSQKMFYNKNKVYLGALLNSGTLGINVTDNINIGAYFTVPNVEDIAYVRLGYRKPYNAGSDMLTANIMLNLGSEALPYEPYGYKIPISSASTTTPVYLGEVETTRKVKKLVLTGQEAYTKQSGATLYSYNLLSGEKAQARDLIMCSHLTFSWSYSTTISIHIYSNLATIFLNFGTDVMNAQPSGNTVAGLKEYLAAQYAAGTPVTVWYVLANEETSVVNEPLMRIGNYADEVSNITIPTTKGSNTLSINTSVQPSNVQLSISGWVPHNNIKEYKNNAWMATSWEGFRDIVRAGNGPTRYPIGTKLYETWGDNTSNAWIIVDYDNSNYNDPDISALGYTHNVVLYEEKINYLKVFDNAEAWLYTESVLPAGTYRFTIPNYDAAHGGDKTYIFTSTVDVPVHGQLTLTWGYNTNPTKVQGYSSSISTTALFNVDIAEWDGTTTSEDLGTIKLAMSDPDSTYGKLNHIHRARYGSNNYYQSDIRQWLNADATANNWWKPTNIFDRPYSNRNTDGGLYLMDEDFRKVIAAPNITCITNNIFETGTSGSTAFKLQTQYTIRDKIFLPTHTELNLSSNPNIGTVFSQYTNAGNDDRIKYRKDNGNAYYYWFRTPYSSIAYYVRHVHSSGALNSGSASGTTGAVRACIIQ